MVRVLLPILILSISLAVFCSPKTKEQETEVIQIIDRLPALDHSDGSDLIEVLESKRNGPVQYIEDHPSPPFFRITAIHSAPFPWLKGQPYTVVMQGFTLKEQHLKEVFIHLWYGGQLIQESSADIAGKTIMREFSFHFDFKISESAPAGEYLFKLLVKNTDNQVLCYEKIVFDL
mmetsp:Transcript_33331/g.37862  ORF Transcript_33331/g.37862 Transcript_33331/m.37862 type:complete len:175 (-) Transcript_33331:807-1331(-)|eukprot:CAMPEP_0114987836 /NCGR_PEP_ID=MMETSP0216-20121206/9247_1 /TAXON_ID=223996 /ORGANISM="Protocruzia adherens, Strain Boccale" /LENGTH=174 /DNA_ID=CAMNT_0002350515 /DNA_START=31 /DNA_END=555 /DNA_ORIENTATION=-